jgi:AsmA protein
MGKWLKRGLIACGVLLALLVLAVFLIPIFVDIETYRPAIEIKASEALGLPVRLSGDMEPTLFPRVGVSLSRISVDNPPGFTRENLLTVESFQVQVELLPLLSKDIRVKRFVLEEPVIILEKDESGKGNWEALGGTAPKDGSPEKETPSEKPAAPPGELPVNALAIDDFSVTDGSIVWIDRAEGVEREVSEVNLRITDVSPETPVPVVFSAVVDGKPFSMQGKIGPVGRQPGKGNIPVDITLTGPGEIRTHLKGGVQDPITAPRVDIDIRIDPFSPRKLMSTLGRQFPADKIGPEALETIAFQSRLTASPKRVSISDGVVALDESRIDFSLTATDFDRPDIDFEITLDRLNVNRYLPPEGSKAAAPKAAEPAGTAGGPPAAADLESLRRIALNGSIRIGTLEVPEAVLSDLRLDLKGREGLFHVRLNGHKEGRPITLEAEVGPIRPDAVPVNLTLSALDTLKIGFKGGVRNPTDRPGLDAVLRVEPFSPREMFSALDRPFPVDTADPGALSRLGFRGKVSAGPDSASISDGTLQLDGSTMTLSASVENPKAPDIRFDIRLDAVNLDRYLPPSSKPSAETERPKAESSDQPPPLDLGPLRNVRIDGQARIGTLKAGGADIQDMRLKIFGENGIFRLDPLTLNLYRGNIAARGVADVRRETPSGELNLKMDGVHVGPLLRDVTGRDLMEGAALAEMSLNMEGLDPDRMKQSLDGTGVFVFTDGAIKGFNVTAMVQNVETAFSILGLKEGGSTSSRKPDDTGARTDFSELKMPFDIVDGRVNITDASLTSPFMRAAVTGSADLVSETLDLRVTPEFVATAKGQGDTEKRTGYMVPVIVEGAFSDPKFRPDVRAMIRMVPEETITEILKDPEKGIDALIDRKKEELRKFLNLDTRKKGAESSEAVPETPRPGRKEASDSTEDKIGEILKELPFGN